MKRYALSLAALALLAAAGGCAPTGTPSAAGSSSAGSAAPSASTSATSSTSDSSAIASRRAACDTIDSAKASGFGAALAAATKIQAAGATQQQVSQAASEFAAALSGLATKVNTAVSQTTDPELKSAATDFAAQVIAVITTINQAAGDPAKIIAAFTNASFTGIEQRVTALCAAG